MKKSLILLGMLGIGYTYAQSTDLYEGKVGINTEEPKATLDITAYKTDGTTKEGLLIPRLKKADVAKIASPETSTLVYVNDVVYNAGTDTSADKRVEPVDAVGFYHYNGLQWIKVKTNDSDDELFYKTGTTQNAIGKNQDMYRNGKLGIGTREPIASIHTEGKIAGANNLYLDISVNPTTGGNSTTDEVFSTLDEAVNYANSVVNNSIIRINIPTGEEYTLSQGIHRNIIFNRGVINIIKTIPITRGASVVFNGSTVNQNIQYAFRTYGNAIISIGNHERTTWNFTAPNQSIVFNFYGDWGNGGEVHLSINRGTLNTNSHAGIKFSANDVVSTGRIILSQWQATIPEGISYANVSRILYANNATVNTSNNIVGLPIIFNGLDTANNNALVERMRVHTNGNVGIGTAAPTHKLHIKSDANPLKLEGLQVSTVGTDKILVADAAGVVKTVERSSIVPTSTTATNGIQSTSKMVCNAENAGKVNYTTIQKDGKTLGVFGFCMQRDTQYVWAYMAGGSNIFGTSADGAEFGAGL